MGTTEVTQRFPFELRGGIFCGTGIIPIEQPTTKECESIAASTVAFDRQEKRLTPDEIGV